MPNLSAEKYAELKKIVDTPGSGLSDAVRERALAAIEGYEADFGDATQQAYVSREAEAPDLTRQLDPNLPLVPQALAVQPASTHPGGDKAAESEWLVSGGENARGTIFVYEPPLQAAQKALLENPAIGAALFEHLPDAVNPDSIAKMTKDSDIYQAYADYQWRKTAEEAAKAGKTAYRYSKAPWLQGGNAMSPIQTLGMKAAGTVPAAMEGVTSFIMGVDDTASFGASKAAAESAAASPQEPAGAPEAPEGTYRHPTLGNVPEEMGQPTFEVQGGNLAQPLETIGAENPTAHVAGQALGALAPWGASNRLFNFVASGGRRLAGEGAGVLARAGAATGAGAVAGAVDQTVREGVGAAANLAQTGETGTTAGEAATRVGVGAGLGGAFGGALELAGSAAKAGADVIRDTPRFRGDVRKLERAGVEFGVFSGPKLSKETKALIKRAQEQDLSPGDVAAMEIAPEMRKAVDAEVKGAIKHITERKQAYFESSEGKQRLPATNLVGRAVDILRRKHDAPMKSKGLQTVDVSGVTPKVKRIFNNEIARVSTKPVEGAIELTAEEADAFLSNSWKLKLAPTSRGSKYSLEGKSLEDLGHKDIQPEKLAAVREKGADAKGITLYDDPEKGLRLVDGRHRFVDAKEKGAKSIYGTVRDPETGKILYQGEIPLTATDGESTSRRLRRQGVEKVYVVPRVHDARSHEELLKGIKGARAQNKALRELQELDEAARIDRDARTVDGKPGGWSAMQAEHAALLKTSKALEAAVAPGGDPFKAIASHGNRRAGEAQTVQALRAAADKAGVREQLERVRNLDPLMRLRDQTSLSAHTGQLGAANRAASKGMLGAFPVLRSLEGPTGPIRGGSGGRFSLIGRNAPVLEMEEEEQQ